MKEELTTKMHGELSISEADELKFRVFTALEVISIGATRAEAMEDYNVTADQLDQHQAEYDALQE